MNSRAVVLSVALFASMAGPAIAQDSLDAPVARAAPEHLSPEHVAAGADLFRAMMIDSGVIDRLFELIEVEIIPDMRTGLLSSPMYRDAPTEQRDALLHVIDTIPSLMRQEFVTALESATPRVGYRFAAHMSREHLSATATFMRSPEMREKWRELVDEIVDADGPTRSFPDWRSVDDFARTPAGQAFGRKEGTLGVIMKEETDQALATLSPRMITIIAGQVCDALGEDCPSNIRDAAGRI